MTTTVLADGLQLLLLLAGLGAARLPLLELAPAVYALLARSLPGLLVLALALAHLELLVLAALLAAFLLHLRLQLAAAALLIVDKHVLRLVGPLLTEVVGAHLGAVGRPLVLAHQQRARGGDGLVQRRPVLLIHQLRLRLLEPVEGVGRLRVLGLVRVDQERLLAVRVLDVQLGHARLQTEHRIPSNPDRVSPEHTATPLYGKRARSRVGRKAKRIEAEGVQDSIDLGILLGLLALPFEDIKGIPCIDWRVFFNRHRFLALNSVDEHNTGVRDFDLVARNPRGGCLVSASFGSPGPTPAVLVRVLEGPARV